MKLKLKISVRLTSKVLSNVLYAVGKMRLQPPSRNPTLLPALLSASRLQLPAFTPQALANAAWALARLEAPPDPRWMAALIEETFLKMGLFNAQVCVCHFFWSYRVSEKLAWKPFA